MLLSTHSAQAGKEDQDLNGQGSGTYPYAVPTLVGGDSVGKSFIRLGCQSGFCRGLDEWPVCPMSWQPVGLYCAGNGNGSYLVGYYMRCSGRDHWSLPVVGS